MNVTSATVIIHMTESIALDTSIVDVKLKKLLLKTTNFSLGAVRSCRSRELLQDFYDSCIFEPGVENSCDAGCGS